MQLLKKMILSFHWGKLRTFTYSSSSQGQALSIMHNFISLLRKTTDIRMVWWCLLHCPLPGHSKTSKWWADVTHCCLCPADFAPRPSQDWLLLMLHLPAFVRLRTFFSDHLNSIPTPIPTLTLPPLFSNHTFSIFFIGKHVFFPCFSAPTTTA